MASSKAEISSTELIDTYLPEWFIPLFTNMGVYLLIVGVSYGIILMVRKNPPADNDDSLLARFLRFAILGPRIEEEQVSDSASTATNAAAGASSGSKKSNDIDQLEYNTKTILLLVFCSLGLLVSYLTWGVLQERIITTEYRTGRFESANMLVFANRLVALIVGLTVVFCTKQAPLRAPYYEFSLTSLSNVLSSFCQLEALKYVSFPMQVLTKSSKMIPVMLMGKIAFGKSYPWYDYVVAVTISAGVTMFMRAENSGNHSNIETNISGLLLLVGYLVFDSFTSQWQQHLFQRYKMSSYQMMVGVNVFSLIFTGSALIQTGELFSSISFMLDNPPAMWDNLIFSLSGAVGQVFLFFTIKTFGALVFTMISTVRQLIAVFLSIVFFKHMISIDGMIGAAIVFLALGYHIYKHDKESKEKKAAAKLAESNNKKILVEEGRTVEESEPLTMNTNINNNSASPRGNGFKLSGTKA